MILYADLIGQNVGKLKTTCKSHMSPARGLKYLTEICFVLVYFILYLGPKHGIKLKPSFTLTICGRWILV